MFDSHHDPSDEWNVPGVDRPRVVPPPTLPPVVLALQAAAQGLRDWRPDQLDGDQALAATRALLLVEQLVMAARTRSLTDVESRRLHRDDGAPTAARWLRRQGLELPAAQLTLARRLTTLPLIADELATGRLTVALARTLQAALSRLMPHVDRADGMIDGQDGEQALYGVIVHGAREVIARARGGFAGPTDPMLLPLLTRLPEIAASPTGQLARLEAAFVVVTGHVEPGLVHNAVKELVEALLPATLEGRGARGERDRGLALIRKPDGTGWHLTGDLDLTCGEQLHTVLQSELVRDAANPVDTERAGDLRRQGLDPRDDDLDLPERCRPRSRRERMHDALQHALSRYLGADLGGTHDKNAVQLMVTVPAQTLDGQPGALPARAASGAVLPLSVVRRWACDSSLTRFALALTGRVLEVSHSERTLKAHERRALHAQTGGICGASGCPRSAAQPGAVMHPHHVTACASTGATSLSETALLCDTDHAYVHQGLVIALRDGRRLGPDGWVT